MGVGPFLLPQGQNSVCNFVISAITSEPPCQPLYWKWDFLALGGLRLIVETWLFLNLWMFLLLCLLSNGALGSCSFFFQGFTLSAQSKGKCCKKRGRGRNNVNTVCSCVKFSKKLKLKKKSTVLESSFLSPLSAGSLGVWDRATVPSPLPWCCHT